MHLTHPQLALLIALLNGMSKKISLNVLSHLFFTPAGDKIILTASDLEMDFFWPLPVSQSPSLRVPVSCPIAWFLKTATRIPKDGHLEIRAENGSVHLLPSKGPSVRSPERSLKIKDAPPFSTTGLTRGGWLSTATMQTALKAMPFISTDETRYVLQGVHIQADGHLVATDGRRLAHAPTPHTTLPESIIVPTRFIQPLAAITQHQNFTGENGGNGVQKQQSSESPCSPLPPVQIPVWLNGKAPCPEIPNGQCATMLLTQTAGCYIRLKIIDGNYPNWRQVIPMDFNTLVTFHAGFMDDFTTLLRTSTRAKDTKVKITLLPGRKVQATLYTDSGTTFTEALGDPLDAGTHASREHYAIAFNAHFFRDTLNFSGLTLRLQDAISPATGGSPDGAQTVLMPMRVNAAVAA